MSARARVESTDFGPGGWLEIGIGEVEVLAEGMFWLSKSKRAKLSHANAKVVHPPQVLISEHGSEALHETSPRFSVRTGL